MKQSFTVSSLVASLKVRLFNGVHVLVDGQPVTLAYDKVRALLAFLLIEAHDYPQSRETLAGLLWPEQSEKEARHSLSQALLKLRQAIDPDNSLIIANRHTVGWQAADHIECDTAVRLITITGIGGMGKTRLAIKRDEFAEATALCQQAWAVAQDLNDPRMVSIQYLVLGNIALAERDFPAAVGHLETAVTISDMTNNADILDEAIMLLGRDAYTGTGEYELAFEALQRRYWIG